ncbi:hypothetical protein J2T11_000435 [Paenarthrobacter nicotinovorans]|uniref:hypothetical protein n=1 Tax=Paenarthrobacter nicotinovorans TaxID=29320 RepID=UPI00277F5392|nr:hypothetical protein [Paenarthrobacter nicotinovorans]MDP9934111.1 hypothetical protein [Paenarthrobacter nicotinovorans]
MNIFNLGGAGLADQESARATGTAMCSRKGCRQDAQWQLLWNNPRIHTPERRKVWLSCGDHREWLEEYLQTRGLWKETVPFADGSIVNEAH